MAVADRAMGLLLTPARLRVWGWRSAMSLADQGLTSGAGFGVNLLLARWMMPEVYGAFAVAFAGFLFVSGFHNVLLLEPMTVLGPSRHAARLPGYFRAQINLHLILAGGLSGAALLAGAILWLRVPGNPLAGAAVGAGMALPFLLLAWLTRRMCYVMQRPAVAVLGSGVYLAFVAAGLLALGHFRRLGSFTAFLLMGCGSVLASWLLLWRLGLLRDKPAAEPDVSWRTVLGENWTYGRWLVGSTVLFSISTQVQTFLAAAILGLGAAGVFRAMQLPALIMAQVIMASGPIILPSFSYDFGRGLRRRTKHRAMLVSLILGVGALSFAVLLTAFSGSAERILFGGKYGEYAWLIPLLSLVSAANGFSQGFSMALRASCRPHFDLVANLAAAPVGAISAMLLMHLYGLLGAALSLVLGLAVYSSVTCWTFFSSNWSDQEREREV